MAIIVKIIGGRTLSFYVGAGALPIYIHLVGATRTDHVISGRIVSGQIVSTLDQIDYNISTLLFDLSLEISFHINYILYFIKFEIYLKTIKSRASL